MPTACPCQSRNDRGTKSVGGIVLTIPSVIDFQGAAVPAQQNSRQPFHHVLAVELLLDRVGNHSGKTRGEKVEGKYYTLWNI